MTDFSDDPDFPNHQPDEPALENPVERLYNVGEKIFGISAVEMREQGWTVFPQERDERRRPARIDGRGLKWSKYYDDGPSLEETARWALQAPNANTAIILGPASGNVFCLDCDILDEGLSLQVQDIAARVLGLSPFRRIGQAPKIALFYRTEAQDLPPYSRNVFQQIYGDTDSHAIEVLARGKAITAYGYHHKTGRYFTWQDEQPAFSSVLAAPLVTPAKLQEFLREVEWLRPFARAHTSVVAAGAAFNGALEVSVEGWTIPHTRTEVEYDEKGLISGGREPWLTAMAFDLVRLNPSRVGFAMANGSYAFYQAGVYAACRVLFDVACDRMTTRAEPELSESDKVFKSGVI